jgi:hypothetical protein
MSFFHDYILKINILSVKDFFHKDKYNEIMEKIGDFSFFNEDDVDFLHTLPKEKLIQIIKIYNINYIENIITLLSDNEKQS